MKKITVRLAETSADSTLLQAIFKEFKQMPAVKEKTLKVSLRSNCISVVYGDTPFYLIQDVSTL